MLTTMLLFSAGLAGGLGTWWFSLDRRRGKEVREIAQGHHLHVDAVHDAYVRAFRYGYAEDLLFLVKKAHPQADGKKISVLRPGWNIDLKEGPSCVEEDTKVP